MTNAELETMSAIKNCCHTSKDINWEQVRVQAAIAAMQSLIMHKGSGPLCASIRAVAYADTLIKELKAEPKEHKIDMVDYVNSKNL